jgi:hypothetical protein
MKTCTKCKEEKPFSEFYKKSTSSVRINTAEINTYRPECKLCIKSSESARTRFLRATDPQFREKNKARCREYNKTHREELRIENKKYRENNREKINKKTKEYYWNNKEKLQQKHKKYREANGEKINAHRRSEKVRKRQNERWKTDPLWRLQRVIGCSIRESFRSKGFKKTSRTHKILGCSSEEFKTYIKNQFKEGMTFNNTHLDHIVPVSLGETEEEIIALNHYSNFQPLSAKDNLKKGNKLTLGIISPENKIRYKEMIERSLKQRSR